MFVLEKILRGLSEETEGKSKLNSFYDELLNKVKDLRISNYKINEYHEVTLRKMVNHNSLFEEIKNDYMAVFEQISSEF